MNLASGIGVTIGNAIMGEKPWTQNEYVIHPLGVLWKYFTYNFNAEGEMDNIFHSSIAHQKSDACDILQELIK